MSRFRVHNASALSARVVIARYGGRSLQLKILQHLFTYIAKENAYMYHLATYLFCALFGEGEHPTLHHQSCDFCLGIAFARETHSTGASSMRINEARLSTAFAFPECIYDLADLYASTTSEMTGSRSTTEPKLEWHRENKQACKHDREVRLSRIDMCTDTNT
jgi:hypothetical protein